MKIPNQIKTRIISVSAAFHTFPCVDDALRCLALYAGFAAIVLTIGLLSGFLRPELMTGTPRTFMLLPLLILIRPAIVEELFFRAILIPNPRETASRRKVVVVSALSLAVFVAMHPLNGYFLRPEAFAVFSNPLFLFFAGLLGLVCTFAYRLTGSLWPPILMHWITVLTWMVFLGGKRLLTGQ